MLGDDYVHYQDQMPEIKEFMRQVDEKEAERLAAIEQDKKKVDFD